MQLASRIHEADDVMTVQELCHSRGWTDDMPIVPPTEGAVRACLEWADVGKAAVVRNRGDSEYAALPSSKHLLVIAAGGPAGGFGAVIPPWLGPKSRAVTAALGLCLDCEPMKDTGT